MCRKYPLNVMVGLVLCLTALSCGESEETRQLAGLQEDMRLAASAIDSLNSTIDASNRLIGDLRARADSLQHVDERLLASVQQLSRDVRHWRSLYTEQQRRNEELATEIERMKREKQADQRTIAQLRTRADSLNGALLVAHSSIRRQGDFIRRLEGDLAQAKEEITDLKRAQVSVRLCVGTEEYMEEKGYLESSRPFGRAFRKAYKLDRKPGVDDPNVRLVPVGDTITLQRNVRALVDRFGRLKEGQDYKMARDGEQARVTFTSELLGGVDVLVVVEK